MVLKTLLIVGSAFTAGYVVARISTPYCRVGDDGGSDPLLRTTARALLTSADAIDRVRPILYKIDRGDAPTVLEVQRVYRELTR